MQNTFPGFKTHTCRTQTHQDFLFKMCQCFFKSIAAHHPQSRNLPQTSHKVSPPLLTKPQTFLGFDLLHTEYKCLLDKSTFRFLLKRKHRDTNQENEETLLLSDNGSSKCDKKTRLYSQTGSDINLHLLVVSLNQQVYLTVKHTQLEQ